MSYANLVSLCAQVAVESSTFLYCVISASCFIAIQEHS